MSDCCSWAFSFYATPCDVVVVTRYCLNKIVKREDVCVLFFMRLFR